MCASETVCNELLLYIDSFLDLTTRLSLSYTCTYLRQYKVTILPTKRELLVDIACNGYVSLLDWIQFDLRPSLNEKVAYHAAKSGHSNILKWLVNNNYNCTNRMFQGAAAGSCLELLKKLSERYIYSGKTNLCDYAAISGSIEILRWVSHNVMKCTSSVILAAAITGQIHVMDYALSNGVKWCPSDRVHYNACKAGQLEVLKWLREGNYGNPDLITSCEIAIEKGHKHIIDYYESRFGSDFMRSRAHTVYYKVPVSEDPLMSHDWIHGP